MSCVWLRNGMVFRGDGTFAASDIAIVDDLIVEVAPPQMLDGSPRAGAGVAKVIDLTGCTVFPGFVNSHIHLTGDGDMLPPEEIAAFARNGVTTVCDMGILNEGSVESFMALAAGLDDHDGPRIVNTGKFISQAGTYGSVHPENGRIGMDVAGPEEVAAVVERMARAGCAGIKTSMDPGPGRDLPVVAPDVFAAVCREARARGLWTAAHVTLSAYVGVAIDCGLDVLAHVPVDPMPDGLVHRVVRRGISVIPTLAAFDKVTSEMGIPLIETALENTRRLHAAGAHIAAGTDFIHPAPPWHTTAIPVRELRLLMRAGLTREEALLAATRNAAEVCGLGERVGVLASGKEADIVAVRGELDDDLVALERPALVINRGKILTNEL